MRKIVLMTLMIIFTGLPGISQSPWYRYGTNQVFSSNQDQKCIVYDIRENSGTGDIWFTGETSKSVRLYHLDQAGALQYNVELTEYSSIQNSTYTDISVVAGSDIIASAYYS